MGEIGLNRLEYLYDLTFCELLLIERGYEMRHRHLWFAERWATYYTMMAFCGSDNMKKSGLNNPTDLLPLPWDQHEVHVMSDKEIAYEQALMDNINAQLAKQHKK